MRTTFLADASSVWKLTASTGLQLCADCLYSSASEKRHVTGLSTVITGKLATSTVKCDRRGTLKMNVGLHGEASA